MDPTAAWQAVQAWPVAERLAFALRLWESLADEAVPEADPELTAELDRRLAAHEAAPSDVRTWEQIAERLRRRP